MRLSNLAFCLSAGLLAAAPAHALTIINSLTAPPGPYNLANPVGTVPAVVVDNTDTYDFPFATIGGTYNVLLQMQASMKGNPAPRLLSFSLYSGLPGSGAFVTSSGAPSLGPAFNTTLDAGHYYLELKPWDILTSPELVSGALTLVAQGTTRGVPEPTTWALTIGGMSLLGLALRRRRALQPA